MSLQGVVGRQIWSQTPVRPLMAERLERPCSGPWRGIGRVVEAMKLGISDVKEEDRGVVAPCGIVCLGCDIHLGEGLEAAKKVVTIWKGLNLEDVAPVAGLKGDQVRDTISTLERFIELREKAGPCPGCFNAGGPSAVCGIARCVKSKGYWTCAECEDYSPGSERPCAQPDIVPVRSPMESRVEMSAMISKRYSGNTRENLSACREKGYAAFVEEVKEKVGQGWRTWQVISREPVFSKQAK